MRFNEKGFQAYESLPDSDDSFGCVNHYLLREAKFLIDKLGSREGSSWTDADIFAIYCTVTAIQEQMEQENISYRGRNEGFLAYSDLIRIVLGCLALIRAKGKANPSSSCLNGLVLNQIRHIKAVASSVTEDDRGLLPLGSIVGITTKTFQRRGRHTADEDPILRVAFPPAVLRSIRLSLRLPTSGQGKFADLHDPLGGEASEEGDRAFSPDERQELDENFSETNVRLMDLYLEQNKADLEV